MMQNMGYMHDLHSPLCTPHECNNDSLFLYVHFGEWGWTRCSCQCRCMVSRDHYLWIHIFIQCWIYSAGYDNYLTSLQEILWSGTNQSHAPGAMSLMIGDGNPMTILINCINEPANYTCRQDGTDITRSTLQTSAAMCPFQTLTRAVNPACLGESGPQNGYWRLY